jgi:hypothetical protein
MKFVFRTAIAVFSIFLLAGGIATAQDLQQQLSKLGREAAIGYTAPILSGWGNDLNSGIYYSADLHNVLGFDIDVSLATSKITDADKKYVLTLPASMTVKASDLGLNGYAPNTTVTLSSSGTNLSYPASVIANTAVGNKDKVPIKTIAGGTGIIKNGTTVLGTDSIPANLTILSLPGGYDLGSVGIGGVPLVVPQLTLGLPFGLEVMGRWIPPIKTDQGKFTNMGFGLRYDIDQWFPFCPVDIAIHFMTQKMTFKSNSDQDIFTCKAIAYGVEMSKKLFILTLYSGFQLENSSLILNDYTGYNFETGQSIFVQGFEINGKDKSRFTVGARLLLFFINLHAEYSFSASNVLTLGAGITIR